MRINSGTRKTSSGFVRLAPAGTPDLLVLHPYCWLEVKYEPTHWNKKSAVLAGQQAFRDRASRLGIPVAVVTNIEDALAFVRGVERR
jgi:hypothetical protein